MVFLLGQVTTEQPGTVVDECCYLIAAHPGAEKFCQLLLAEQLEIAGAGSSVEFLVKPETDGGGSRWLVHPAFHPAMME